MNARPNQNATALSFKEHRERPAEVPLVTIVGDACGSILRSCRDLLVDGEQAERCGVTVRGNSLAICHSRVGLVILDDSKFFNESLARELRDCGYSRLIACVGSASVLEEESSAFRAGADWMLASPVRPTELGVLLSYARFTAVPDRAYPVHEPFLLVPSKRALVVGDELALLTEPEYDLLALLAASFEEWVSFSAIAAHFGWRLSDSARQSRVKELVRRVRRHMGSYTNCIQFRQGLGSCWIPPRQ